MSLIKKVSIVLVCVMMFSFCAPGIVRADDGFGGKLLDPIMSLIVSLGDGAMSLLQKVVLNVENTIINIDTSSSIWSIIIVVAVIAIATAVTIAAIVVTRWRSISYWTRNSKSSNNNSGNRSFNLSNYNWNC